MASVFTKIINGEIPCYKIYEDEQTLAFLDIRPHQLGHTLIVPKVEVDHFLDVMEPFYTKVFQNAKFIGKAIQKATGCKRIGAVVLGFDIPHFHLHLIPLFESHDIDQSRAKERSEEEMKDMHQKILAALKEQES